MKNFLLVLAMLLVVVAMLLVIGGQAMAQQPVRDPAPKCATCSNCRCSSCPTQCRLPQTTAPIVDTRGRWPWQGPFRWTGAVGRWGLGARPRFQVQR